MNTQRLLAVGGLVSMIAASVYVLGVAGLDEGVRSELAQYSGLRPLVAQGAGPEFAETEVRGRATAAALVFLFSEDGPAARLAERGYASPRSDALTITGVDFVKDARKVSSTHGTSEFGRPMSIWTVSFALEGLKFLEIRLEDGTGKVRGATAHLPPAQ